MSLSKNGVRLSCELCRYLQRSEPGSFDIAVPVSVPEAGFDGVAVVRCTLSDAGHHLQLLAWQDAAGRTVDPPSAAVERLTPVLDFVASKRLCGNERFCPHEVIRVVRQDSRGDQRGR